MFVVPARTGEGGICSRITSVAGQTAQNVRDLLRRNRPDGDTLARLDVRERRLLLENARVDCRYLDGSLLPLERGRQFAAAWIALAVRI
jgi:hypothetical protein